MEVARCATAPGVAGVRRLLGAARRPGRREPEETRAASERRTAHRRVHEPLARRAAGHTHRRVHARGLGDTGTAGSAVHLARVGRGATVCGVSPDGPPMLYYERDV